MKSKLCLSTLIGIISVFIFSGSGYKGTLPDLNIKMKYMEENAIKELKLEQNKKTENELLPLDKLTIPIITTVKIDKRLVAYKDNMADIVRQLERIKEVLDTDKSFKNFIAAANVLDLTTQNHIGKYNEQRFSKTNSTLSDINYDVQQIKKYWIDVNKNAPYVSNTETHGVYSGAVLNEQLNKFSKVLDYAIRDIKTQLDEMKQVKNNDVT